MVNIFWDCKGLMFMEFMSGGETITSAAYCEVLHQLRRAIQNKRRRILSVGIMLFHGNGQFYTAAAT